MKFKNKNIISSIPVTFVIGMFFLLLLSSCENDIQNIKKVTATDETPDQITNGLHSFYSDSGIVVYELIAKRMELFEKPESKTLFKNGLEVNYFSKKGEVISTITCDYAEIIQAKNLVVCRNNVTFTNHEKEQTLKTEELFWDQNLKKVRTTKNFYLESPTMSAKGVGLNTDETFNEFEMFNFSLIYKDTTDGFSKNE